MPICKNDPKRKYKGDEPSPKGLGWCAHGEKEGKTRKGQDGNKWIVKEIKNGSLRWVKDSINKKKSYVKKTSSLVKQKSIKKSEPVNKVKSVKKTTSLKINNKWFRELSASQKNTYKKLTTITKKELEKVGINVIIYPLHLTDNGYYISDYAWEYAREVVDNKDPFIIIVLKINSDILDLQKDKLLHIQHSNITYNNKKNLIEVFKKTLGTKYKWNGNQNHTINIKL